jgi:hypothetical protein
MCLYRLDRILQSYVPVVFSSQTHTEKEGAGEGSRSCSSPQAECCVWQARAAGWPSKGSCASPALLVLLPARCSLYQFSPPNTPSTSKGEKKPRSPYKLSLIETPLLSSRLQHADHTALFLRVFGLVVDCCRSSHSTAPASNRPRLLLSSSIDRSPIHRLTISRIVTHPRLLKSAHSTLPRNSKSAHSPSPVLWRVACSLRVAAATATRQQQPTQQPAALHSSIATPPPHRCD